MRVAAFLSACALAASSVLVEARSAQYAGKRVPEMPRPRRGDLLRKPSATVEKRAADYIIPQSANTTSEPAPQSCTKPLAYADIFL